MLLTSLTTYLRARRAPARVTALVLTGAVCALVARVPMPALSTDLDAAGYPAVLIASVGPVLLGVLAVAPAPTRLRWLTDTPGTRRRLLASVEFLIVVAMTSIAAAGVGLPADQVGVAVQNAALTGFGASVLAVPLGRGRATAVVGAGAIALLLTSPSLPPAAWVLIDTLADPADWWAVWVIGTIAAMATVLARPEPDARART